MAAEPIEPPELSAGPRGADAGIEDPKTPGAYIRVHRQRQGISLDQLAASTKIPRRQLELLEADRFEELPGVVFTKGFLRCCARALDLDPDAVMALLYEREREQLRARRREAVASAGPSSVIRPDDSRRASAHQPNLAYQVRAWVVERLDHLPSARILMWLVVAILVAIVVLIAFTLASGQSQQIGVGGL
ncbi:helix-turn-helix domain-containing protein [Pseudenhygromyxa sp. WMMC2535]|nr:helix-turn-helix domain-containing protein [Pseudenhygromyxa sp. WMMC2535]